MVKLVSTSLLLLGVPAPPTPAFLAASHGNADQAPEELNGSLDVRLHPQGEALQPAAEMVLTDPRQRRTGRDPRSGERFQEIPGSYYEVESLDSDVERRPGPQTAVLHIANPLSGRYRLEVIGEGIGDYALEIQALDRAMRPSRAEVVRGRSGPGSVDRYRIRYSDVEGAQVEVEALTEGSHSERCAV